MYITEVVRPYANGKASRCVLLRESYRHHGKVKTPIAKSRAKNRVLWLRACGYRGQHCPACCPVRPVADCVADHQRAAGRGVPLECRLSRGRGNLIGGCLGLTAWCGLALASRSCLMVDESGGIVERAGGKEEGKER